MPRAGRSTGAPLSRPAHLASAPAGDPGPWREAYGRQTLSAFRPWRPRASGEFFNGLRGTPLIVLIAEDETLIGMALEDALIEAGYTIAGVFATSPALAPGNVVPFPA
jgi:hypothetical protein